MIGTSFVAPPLSVRAATTNLLYISPVHTSNLPLRTIFNVTVKVANFDPFNGWNIYVSTNSSIINPVDLSITGDIFEVNGTGEPQTELAHCINGGGTTVGCSTDRLGGNGIVQSAVSYLGAPVAGSGLLFTISYNVTGVGFSDIKIFNDALSNGSKTPVAHTTEPGTYGNKTLKPDFDIEPISKVVITLAQSHNVSQNVIVTIDSIDNFSGQANISVSATITVSVSPSQISLHSGGSNSSTVTVTATNTTTSTQYLVNVTATVGSIQHWAILSVRVNPIPDFVMSVTPSILKVHATSSGSSVVTLDTQTGFSGSIRLKMDVPPIPGLIASLAETDFTISPGQPATTVFAVRTPVSDFPFKYLINITASSSQSSTHVPFTITVRSPSPDFGFQISGTGFVLQAGQSRTFTLNATSIDYFRGEIFLLAFSLSGMKESFTKPSVALEYGNSSTTQVTLTTDPFLAPGNHFMNLTALGTTFLGASVNHTVTETITVIPPPVVVTILGLQPVAYFGVIGVLWIGVVSAAIRQVRKPKQKRFLT